MGRENALDIGAWLKTRGLERYERAFRDADIDVDLLAELSDDDLQKIGVESLGDRKRLLKAARVNVESAETAKAPAARATQSSRRERRQLTVMFVDLIGSTALSVRFDAEDMGDLLKRYQDTVSRVIKDHGGIVGQYLGDGVLAYFGWPIAHEDEAARAIRAGLEITRAVAELKDGDDDALSCRVGVATGQVMVGELIGEGIAQQQMIVGETPNLAARLQDLAEANSIVACQQTHDLTLNEYRYADIGQVDLKGFAEPVRCWRVVAPIVVESRFAARTRERVARLVGREREWAQLDGPWRKACGGNRQVVIVEGEAGIGKSCLVSTYWSSVADDASGRLIYQCSELQQNMALHPVTARLEYAARIAPDDPLPTRFRKLADFLASDLDSEQIAILARAMAVLPADQKAIAQLPPAQFKKRLFSTFLNLVRSLAGKKNLFIVMEDIHWIDATTFELLNHVIANVGDLPVLFVLTARSGYPQPAGAENHHVLRLGRLSDVQARAMIEALWTSRPALSREQIDGIVAQTDGNPLFIEQALHMLQTRPEELFAPAAASRALSLRQLLQARLDQLGDDKRVAQFAAVLGRQFSHALLTATWPYDRTRLSAGLDRLQQEGLIEERRQFDQIDYRFAHALIRDAAYDSLLRKDRRAFHRNVARALETIFADLPAREPHLLAQHHLQAGAIGTAIPYFISAAQLSLTRSAYIEARNHLEQALGVLDAIADAAERNKLELALRPPYGAALVAICGYTASQVEANYERILALSRVVDDHGSRFHALLGLMRAAIVRAEIARARALGDDLLAAAAKVDVPEFRLTAELLVGIALLIGGRLERATIHLGRATDAYDPVAHRGLAHRLGQDPGITGYVWAALGSWMRGRFADAANQRTRAESLARNLNHPFTLTYILSRLILLYRLSGDLSEVQRLANETRKLASSLGFQAFEASAEFWLAEVNAHLHQDASQLDAIASGISGHTENDQRNNVGYMLVCLAERALEFGRHELAGDALARGEAEIAQTDARWCESELYRIRGQLARATGDTAAAAAWFGKSIELATSQGASSLQLRSALDLARLEQQTGVAMQGLDALQDVVALHDRSAETAELVAARSLLRMPHKKARKSSKISTK